MMDIKDNLKSIYIYEQNLLKSVTDKLLECNSDIVHDYILSIFDEIDDLNRYLYKFLVKNKYIEKEKTSKKEKEQLYDKLDSMYLEINL